MQWKYHEQQKKNHDVDKTMPRCLQDHSMADGLEEVFIYPNANNSLLYCTILQKADTNTFMSHLPTENCPTFELKLGKQCVIRCN